MKGPPTGRADYRPRQRVWFYSELYWPEETSTGYFISRIAEDAATDAQVFVVCSQPTYSARGTVAPRFEVRHGVRIARLRSTTFDKDRLTSRAINMLTFSTAVFVHALVHLRRGDIAVAVTNPPLMPYLVRVAAAARRARFVLLIHDLYPEVLTATGALRSGTPVVRALQRASAWLYRSAARVVVLGRDMQARVNAVRGMAARSPVHLIPNWGDVESLRPDAPAGAAVRRVLKLEHQLIVQYMGNMGRTHDVMTIVACAEALSADRRVHFHMIGWGAQRDMLEAEVTRRALPNVTLQGPCSSEELNGYLNAADVAIISFRKGMAGLSVPSRLYNVMAAGRPVVALADPGSELAQVVADEDIGWVLPPEDPAALSALVARLADAPDELQERGRRARRAAELRYSRSVAASAWKDLIQDLERTPATPEVAHE